ncbi:putative transcriptional regulator, LysR family (ModE-like) [Candidatus Terasakiella magnetica]|uniref:Putative transcriptional regulator, LysR family (ModE-like) n=1 Tax=Candidatus Terasakiella magnetica TaxID=1867952 RepID=A0A1C3RDH9_9PROT|nr:LysR family transcriptional regulator [Candidatus Terasakiella magnetica]SCA55353.1 putative transcriptional regulator, LysR family (ModE-like) [Candidatus Terasakiella magnetica]
MARKETKLRIRIAFPTGHIGPGKIALLEQIQDIGSISGAAKEMDMTYRRAWHLLETVKTVLNEDVVETSVGGKSGGGASLTPVGKELIRLYREAEEGATQGAAPLLKKMDSLLKT